MSAIHIAKDLKRPQILDDKSCPLHFFMATSRNHGLKTHRIKTIRVDFETGSGLEGGWRQLKYTCRELNAGYAQISSRKILKKLKKS
jgi:hypothetical protein